MENDITLSCRICPSCGAAFETTRPRKIYCSLRCKKHEQYKRYYAKHRAERIADVAVRRRLKKSK